MKCSGCGGSGFANYGNGDVRDCPDCAAQILDDGFGNQWVKCGRDCEMQIVRPGKVQCSKCDRAVTP